MSIPPDRLHWHSLPLRPADRPPRGQGLSRDLEFNTLLKVSREQRAKLRTQKVPDLRNQSPLQNQNLEQRMCFLSPRSKVESQRNLEAVERRTRFLSKVKDLSCAPTTSIPEVPPHSPTIVYCSMSLRGFESEFSAFEVTAEISQDLAVVTPSTNRGWNEHDILIPKQPLKNSQFPPAMPKISRHISPTLDEITSRLKPAHRSYNKGCSQSQLPHFLKAPSSSPGSADNQIRTLPVRSLALNDEKFNTILAQHRISPPPSLGHHRCTY